MITKGSFELKHFIQTLALIAAVGGLFIQLHNIQNQLWLQTFMEYTRRYNDVMVNLPFEAVGLGEPAELSTLAEDQQKAVIRGMRRYFNLCSEELYLHQKKRVDDETWGIWKSGMWESAHGRFFGSSWRYLRPEYRAYPAFCDLIDGVLASAGQGGPAGSTSAAKAPIAPGSPARPKQSGN
jgi:hypothetical protein